MPRSLGISVQRKNAQTAIRHLGRKGLLDPGLRVQRAGDRVLIPIVSEPSPDQAASLEALIHDYQILNIDFAEKSLPVRTLDEALRDKIPTQLYHLVPHSIDIIGSVAVVELAPELYPHRRVVAEAVMQVHGNVETVLAKSGPVGGEWRLREFEVLAGSGKTETLHRENGCLYYLDVSRVYFSPRLSHERARVAAQVKEGEVVVDMFAGVGPFSILIAHRLRDVRIHAIDANPDAVRYLERNIDANRVRSKISTYLGDAAQVVQDKLTGMADRVIMNLPEKASQYLGSACRTLKPTGGTIHYYEFIRESDDFSGAQTRLREEVSRHGRGVEEFSESRRVRPTAPHEWQIVLDAKVR